MRRPLGRRQFLARAGAALLGGALAGCSFGGPGRRVAAARVLSLLPPRASTDRITGITVCTRPFRAQGPRLEVEQVLGKTVVHNYGHGGSGWSLSWGSSAMAAELALAGGERQVAVMRICFEQYATPEFRQLWERMARRSFATYQTLLGLPGAPVEFIDVYFVADSANAARGLPAGDPRPRFADLQRELIDDLIPRSDEFAPGTHPLGARYLRRSALMMFNLPAYTRMLMSDFLAAGGRIEIDEFHAPADLVRVREKTLINATGYGARALFDDASVIPVRGQLARMIPQPQVDYGLIYKGVAFVPRRDGLVFQVIGETDYYGFNDETTVPDRAEAELAVNTIAGLFRPTA